MSQLHNDDLRNIFYGNGQNNGMNFYDHLVALLTEIDNTKETANSLDNLEKISNFLKMNKFIHFQPQSDEELKKPKTKCDFGVLDFSTECKNFLKVKRKKI